MTAFCAPLSPSSSASSSMCGDLSRPQSPSKPQFAFASINGTVHLVQIPEFAPGGMSSALMVSDLHIFRHEFITIFRYSHHATVHPADLHILEAIDDESALYEEEKGTVFLARDVMARMQKLTMDARRPGAMAMAAAAPHMRHPRRAVSRIH